MTHTHNQEPLAADHSAAENHPANFRLALVATAHCLFGCGLGEIVGMIIGMAVGLSNTATVVVAIVLGFVFGIALGVRPLVRAGFAPAKALRQTLVAESLGIAVMEAVDVAVLASIPGAMDAHFTDSLFWLGMGIALAAGYIAAVPVNYLFIRAGIRHQH